MGGASHRKDRVLTPFIAAKVIQLEFQVGCLLTGGITCKEAIHEAFLHTTKPSHTTFKQHVSKKLWVRFQGVREHDNNWGQSPLLKKLIVLHHTLTLYARGINALSISVKPLRKMHAPETTIIFLTDGGL